LSNQLLLGQLSLGELDWLLARRLGSLDGGLLLLSEDLNMARSVHVRTNSTVSSVCSSSASLSLVALNVGQDEIVNVERLGLGVGDEVLQESNDDLGGLDGPTTLSVLELLGLSSSTNTTIESTEWNASLLLNNSVEVLDSISHSGSPDGSADFEGVLEVNADVCSSGLASYKKEKYIDYESYMKRTLGWIGWFTRVLDH
jgi:hypothetical protein